MVHATAILQQQVTMARSGEPNAGVWITMEHGILEGIHLFNAQKFFEAHEALETVWLKAAGAWENGEGVARESVQR